MNKDRPAGGDARNAGSRKAGPDDQNRKYIIQLTKKGFFGLIVILLIGFIWVFIFGIILGRGYRPEKDIPELAAVLPNKTTDNRTLNITEPLKPEELEFHTRLQEKTSRVDKVETRVDPAAHRPVPRPQPEPETAKKAPETATKSPEAVQKKPDAPSKAADPKTPAGAEERYTWIYQVAAFKDNAGAERLRARIAAKGLKTSIKKTTDSGAVFYKVQMHFSGTQPERKAAVTILNDMGFEKPILVFKERI